MILKLDETFYDGKELNAITDDELSSIINEQWGLISMPVDGENAKMLDRIYDDVMNDAYSYVLTKTSCEQRINDSQARINQYKHDISDAESSVVVGHKIKELQNLHVYPNFFNLGLLGGTSNDMVYVYEYNNIVEWIDKLYVVVVDDPAVEYIQEGQSLHNRKEFAEFGGDSYLYNTIYLYSPKKLQHLYGVLAHELSHSYEALKEYVGYTNDGCRVCGDYQEYDRNKNKDLVFFHNNKGFIASVSGSSVIPFDEDFYDTLLKNTEGAQDPYIVQAIIIQMIYFVSDKEIHAHREQIHDEIRRYCKNHTNGHIPMECRQNTLYKISRYYRYYYNILKVAEWYEHHLDGSTKTILANELGSILNAIYGYGYHGNHDERRRNRLVFKKFFKNVRLSVEQMINQINKVYTYYLQ